MVQTKEKAKQIHKEYQDALKVKEPRCCNWNFILLCTLFVFYMYFLEQQVLNISLSLREKQLETQLSRNMNY